MQKGTLAIAMMSMVETEHQWTQKDHTTRNVFAWTILLCREKPRRYKPMGKNGLKKIFNPSFRKKFYDI
jgi:hypothetical protein